MVMGKPDTRQMGGISLQNVDFVIASYEKRLLGCHSERSEESRAIK